MVHDRYMLSYDDLSNRSCCHPLRFPVRNLCQFNSVLNERKHERESKATHSPRF